MKKFKTDKLELDSILYFAIQCPFLKAYNVAHIINSALDIELTRSLDFDNYNGGKNQLHSYYTDSNDLHQCNYHLIQNKNPKPIFLNQQSVDYWLLTEVLDGLEESRIKPIKAEILDNLSKVEQFFSIDEISPEKLPGYEDFVIDFSEHHTKLLCDRREKEDRENYFGEMNF